MTDYMVYSTAQGYDDEGGYGREDTLVDALKEYVERYCGGTFAEERPTLIEHCPLTVEVRPYPSHFDPTEKYELTSEQALDLLDGWIGVEP